MAHEDNKASMDTDVTRLVTLWRAMRGVIPHASPALGAAHYLDKAHDALRDSMSPDRWEEVCAEANVKFRTADTIK